MPQLSPIDLLSVRSNWQSQQISEEGKMFLLNLLSVAYTRAMDNGVEGRLLDSQIEKVDDLEGRIYDESKKIWRVALPGVLSRVASFGSIVVTQSFIGHISELDLAAYALVQTLTVRFVNGILVSLLLLSCITMFFLSRKCTMYIIYNVLVPVV